MPIHLARYHLVVCRLSGCQPFPKIPQILYLWTVCAWRCGCNICWVKLKNPCRRTSTSAFSGVPFAWQGETLIIQRTFFRGEQNAHRCLRMRQESNLQPSVSETDALPFELPIRLPSFGMPRPHPSSFRCAKSTNSNNLMKKSSAPSLVFGDSCIVAQSDHHNHLRRCRSRKAQAG